MSWKCIKIHIFVSKLYQNFTKTHQNFLILSKIVQIFKIFIFINFCIKCCSTIKIKYKCTCCKIKNSFHCYWHSSNIFDLSSSIISFTCIIIDWIAWNIPFLKFWKMVPRKFFRLFLRNCDCEVSMFFDQKYQQLE